MRARKWIGVAVVAMAVTSLFATTAAPGVAAPTSENRTGPLVGARTLGDPLLPQLGNGGYDALHYRIDLDYDPAANRFDSAVTTMTAIAKQPLREFSMDFQADLTVSSVTVDGRRANFKAEAATPPLSEDETVTQPMKLVVRPTLLTWPKTGHPFVVVVRYSGTPQPMVDPDTSIEGWIPACYPVDPPQTCDGAFVVGEPMGSQSWFPSNNYPTDKATFDTVITVPKAKTALGVGELVARIPHRDGTTTWHWREDDPTATYLVTATVGDFLFSSKSTVEASSGRKLPVYNAVDSSASDEQRGAVEATLALAPDQINFLSGIYGKYPFDSTGAVVDRVAGVGYALEVQTKPLYAGDYTTGDLSLDPGTQVHELAHQWVGNSVTLKQWSDVWFNEGWANWTELYWQFSENGGEDPAAVFDDLYANTPDEDWAVAPAVLDGDPANMFVSFPTYDRGAMTVQGYREIVGDAAFFDFAKAIQRKFAYGNISTPQFIDFAKKRSGLTGAKLERLDQYFQQWLYGETKPTILPETVIGA
jgi:aminopeptidase N